MEYNNTKTLGKVYNFDGEAGTIITPDKEYIFNLNNIKNSNGIQNEEMVAFYPSTLRFGNETYNIAREIESIPKEKVKKPQK